MREHQAWAIVSRNVYVVQFLCHLLGTLSRRRPGWPTRITHGVVARKDLEPADDTAAKPVFGRVDSPASAKILFDLSLRYGPIFTGLYRENI